MRRAFLLLSALIGFAPVALAAQAQPAASRDRRDRAESPAPAKPAARPRAAKPAQTETPAVENIEVGRARAAFLSAELELAKEKSFYVVFDFEKNEIQLRARGTVFRSWTIRSFRFGGTGLSPAPLTLTERIAPNAPTRTIITPPEPPKENPDGTVEEAPYKEPDPFEVVEMPTRYQLNFGDDITVSVFSYRSEADSWFQRALHAVSWDVSMVLRRLKGDKSLLIELTVSPEDAQFFYWGLVENMRALVWDPRF
jgi:hypothetical protein